MPRSNILPIFEQQARLKRKLRRHLHGLGFMKAEDGRLVPPGEDKETLRKMHLSHRRDRLRISSELIVQTLPALLPRIANGAQINPDKLKFSLQKVEPNTEESRFFKVASLSWSVPVSNGFGRRLRYLVLDESNGCIAGLIAIGDPVFNLNARDNLIGWDAASRGARLANVLDAYVLGALPPYNMVLGGKAVACLVRTRDIYDDFESKYGALAGIISQKNKRARLLAVTTTSALGRSSVYNRLRLGEQSYFSRIGFTTGWGHFHVPDDLFWELREFLVSIDHPYAKQNRFGHGPNWKMRTIREALKALGVKESTLHHGLQREVFLSELATNAIDILRTGRGKPNISTLKSVSEVGALAVDRWVRNRCVRRPEYRAWQRDVFVSMLEQRLSTARSEAKL